MSQKLFSFLTKIKTVILLFSSANSPTLGANRVYTVYSTDKIDFSRHSLSLSFHFRTFWWRKQNYVYRRNHRVPPNKFFVLPFNLFMQRKMFPSIRLYLKSCRKLESFIRDSLLLKDPNLSIGESFCINGPLFGNFNLTIWTHKSLLLQIAFGRGGIVLRVTLMGWEQFFTSRLYWTIYPGDAIIQLATNSIIA